MRHLVPLATALAMVATGCVILGDDGDADLTIDNQSDFALTAVHVARVGDPHWGENLRPEVMHWREQVVIRDLDCGTYDVLVVANSGVRCERPDLALCFHDEEWTITNTTLAACALMQGDAP